MMHFVIYSLPFMLLAGMLSTSSAEYLARIHVAQP
jgi:hypothetical protein